MKRIAIILTHVLLYFAGLPASFTLVALTSNSAYAYDSTSLNTGRAVTQTHPARPDGDVRIDNLAGTLKIRGWDKDQVRVTGTLGSLVKRLEINTGDSGISIKVVLPHDVHSSGCDECADLTIDVPVGSRLDASTVSADIDARGLTSAVRLGTVSGTLELDSSALRIDVHSISGDVTVSGSAKDAHITASSVSGGVRVTGASGSLHAESVSGDVKVIDGHLIGAEMISTSGNLTFQSSLSTGGDYEFHDISGDEDLGFGLSPSAHFDVSSFSGDIDNSFGPRPKRASKYSPGMELHFTSGSGSAQVSARTLSGDIRIHQ